ncbi:hypothetical protein J3R82DRAFT_6787 [Butyriboletus roseoflavus]|nr:hypothetical protein J3R82DRAFT_6787 [Butyriboletus roseoflavus]
MFISPSSLTLNSTVFASPTISGNIHSARPYPFPDLLPLSTLLAPPPDQSSTPPSSCTSFSPGPRLPPPSELSSTMPPSRTVRYPYDLNRRDVIIPSNQSTTSVSSASDLLGPNTDTSTSSGFTLTSTPTSTLPVLTTLTTYTVSISSYSSTYSTRSPVMSSPVTTSSSTYVTTESPSVAPETTTTVVFSTTMVTSVDPPSPLNSPSPSTYTVTSVLLGQGGTITDFVTSSGVLSTESPGSPLDIDFSLSPGSVAAIVVGILGVVALAALWLFCARRRHRELVQEAARILPENHTLGPLDDEIPDLDELGCGDGNTDGHSTSRAALAMEERYAGILAVLHLTERFGRGNEAGSTGGVYGSHHDTATDVDGDDDVARASSPTLPLHAISPDDIDDSPYTVPLSPPPPVSLPSYYQTTHPAPPPAYHRTSRRKSSPGPDAAAWLGGYSAAPSCNSHYARSQTLGSGSGSVDALTRTRTGSEELLLGLGKVTPDLSVGISTPEGVSSTTATDPGGNKVGLGSAFGSPAGSMYSPSGVHLAFQHDTSGSYDARTVSGSGSYGYARSGTPSTFDALRSVSSQGALSSTYSHVHSQGFRFGLSRPASSSSGGTGQKAVSNRHSFGVPPTSFRSWRDWGSTTSDKEKQAEKPSLRQNEWIRKSSTSASTSGSMDEKQGRGSPVMGVRGLLGRLRRTAHTPSPHSSNKDLPSPTQASMDVDPERAAADRMTPPPIQIEAATPHRRRRFSFILSNPDPRPPSPYFRARAVVPSDMPPCQELHPIHHKVPTGDPGGYKPASRGAGGLQPATPLPTGYMLASAPSPVPTEESRLAEGLLHPRLQIQGRSDASLRDFEDYSRPIGGVVENRLYSTTTFGTQDDIETRSPGRGTPVQGVVPDDEHEHEHEHEAVDVSGPSTPRVVFLEIAGSSTTSLHLRHPVICPSGSDWHRS